LTNSFFVLEWFLLLDDFFERARDMNDLVLFGGIALAVAVCVFAFFLFHIYRGTFASLQNAKVGEVYNFEYLQPLKGDTVRFLARVVDVQKLNEDAIRRLNRFSSYRRWDSKFKRTNHLITAQTADGKIRNFYAERTRNVRKPALGELLFKSGVASFFV
jgi:hypothetical protein